MRQPLPWIASATLLLATAACVAVRPAAPSADADGRTVRAQVPVQARAIAGTLLGPNAHLVSDLGASVVSEHGGGVVSNNGGTLVANHGAGMRLLALADLVAPLAGARVRLVDAHGNAIGDVTANADASGRYRLTAAADFGPLAFIRAEGTVAGRTVVLLAAVPALLPGDRDVPLDPATTLAAHGLQAQLERGAAPNGRLAAVAAREAAVLASAMDALAVATVALGTHAQATAVYDRLASDPTVAPVLTTARTTADEPSPSPTTGASAGPTTAPSAGTPAPASPTPGGPASPPASPTASPTPTAAPPTPTPVPARTPVPIAVGALVTLAGDGTDGFADGPGTSARFKFPAHLAVDRDANVYVGDGNNERVRKITPDGTVTTIAGTGTQGYADGAALTAQFHYPYGIALRPDGGLYIGEGGNDRLRLLTPGNMVVTVAGDGNYASTDGVGTGASLKWPWGVALGPDGALYVAEPDGNRIRRVVVDGANVGTVTTVAGTGAAGNQDGPATSATFNGPIGLAVGPDRTIYVIEGNGARLRKIAPDGMVSTLAGTGAAGYVDGPGASAQFSAPNGIALDPDGSLYVADSGNDRIRKVTPAGQVTTLAGGGSDTGPATTLLAARVYHPVGVATTGDGYLYVTVGWGGRICKLRIR